MEMTITIILQLVTIAASLFSIIITVVVSKLENQKTHYLEIVTKQRMKNKEEVQRAAQTIIKNSHPQMLDSITDEQIKECIDAEAIIATIFKSIYEKEAELIDCINDLIAELKKHKTTKENFENVVSARDLFILKFSIYDQADWIFIKNQARGENKEFKDYDSIYLKVNEEFEQSQKK